MFKDKVGTGLKYKHIYLCHVDKYIGAYNPHTGEVVGYKSSDMFVPFVKEILEKYPEYSPHNIINDGVAEVIRKKIKADILEKVFVKNLKNLVK